MTTDIKNRERKQATGLLISLFLILHTTIMFAHLPRPDHIVIVIFQNKGYSQIVGSSQAPYINSFLVDTNTAYFTQSYALVHPSQPNYLMLYSGGNQGVTNDNVPTNTPFTTCNLGASLIQKNHTFTGYSESMPSAGYLGYYTSLYARKHNPWSDWQGSGTNNVPAAVNQPFTAFPSDYSLLPDVSIVVPNIINCMHDGTINQGDSWLHGNIEAYRLWALNNNSLLVVTFDEDDGNEGNHILTFFYGPMVRGGVYNSRIDHYDLLRTLEDIYALPACGHSAQATPIDYVWKNGVAGILDNQKSKGLLTVFPNPAKGLVSVEFESQFPSDNLDFSIVGSDGQVVYKKQVDLVVGKNEFTIDLTNIASGVYFVNMTSRGYFLNQKVVVSH